MEPFESPVAEIGSPDCEAGGATQKSNDSKSAPGPADATACETGGATQESNDSKSGPGPADATATSGRPSSTKKIKRGPPQMRPPSAPPDKKPRKYRKDANPTSADQSAGTAGGVTGPVVASAAAAETPTSPTPTLALTPSSTPGSSRVFTLGPPLTPPPEEDGLGDDRSREAQRMQSELAALREQCQQQKRRLGLAQADRAAVRKTLSCMLVRIAKYEDSEEREAMAAERYHLGVGRQAAPGLDARRATWEGGYEADEIVRIKDRIREDRMAISRLRRQICQQGRARTSGAAGTAREVNEDGTERNSGSGDEADEIIEARELNASRMPFLAREELAVKEREQRLEVGRALHMRRMQRLEAAERSNFRTYPLFQADRYQLLNMVGRGGFSEVFRAYDFENNRYCAVKIHELSKDMTDPQRQSYIRRAMREYDIQKVLNHPRVVTLQDCFPISTRAFGTVLELCEGETLDEYMKRYGPLPEREARGIVIQIFSGLKYMNTNGRKIIHYDLKPGNLFFYCGEVKIADFGLSKVVHENHGESIDLTSQGAGTYWYLPPECFVQAGQEDRPKISNKVDVWSTGVIFFEMLFKRRPFGHGQSQEALLRSCMAATQPFALEIPQMPKVSADGKDFLKRVLTINREQRPDVIEAFNDPYLRPKPRTS